MHETLRATLFGGVGLLASVSPDALARAAVPPVPVASYELDAKLDAERHIIDATGTITWTNTSRRPARQLYFHLYLNAFEGPETLFSRLGGGRHGGLTGQRGFIRVSSLSSPRFSGVNLWENAAEHSPGDENDRTDISVPLPEPILPGETLTLHVDFEAQLPEIVERTGFRDDFHLVAQWYPKLAKRHPDGSWVHFSFHPHAEFFADFGSYDVRLNVPANHVVGSTGHAIASSEEAGRLHYRAVAHHVHDFAWTSWPGFHDESREIAGVHVRVLSPPETRLARQATWRTLESGLPHFESAYGSYPYPTLTVVHPPRTAQRAGGMEYPTFITTGGSELLTALGFRVTEIVTIHELGHQWFQGLLASNEAAHPFLDEGINSYAEWRYMEAEYGTGSLLDFAGLRVSLPAAERVVGVSSDPHPPPIAQPASAFDSFGSLARLVYSKTALSLETLGRTYGKDLLHRALHDYALAHRFGHPEPKDFFRSLKQSMGSEAAAVAREMLATPAYIDLQVADVQVAPSGSRSPTTFRVERRGNVSVPFDVAATDSSGKRHSFRCSGERKICTFSLPAELRLARIVVDPEQKILLDSNLYNNRRLISPPSAKTLSRWSLATLWQLFIQTIAP